MGGYRTNPIVWVSAGVPVPTTPITGVVRTQDGNEYTGLITSATTESITVVDTSGVTWTISAKTVSAIGTDQDQPRTAD